MKAYFAVITALLMLPVSDASAANTPADVLQTCLKQPAPPEGSYRVRQFGRDAERSARILSLIAAGEKTVTFTSPWIYDGNPALTPVVGQYTVVNDFADTPRLVLRTTALKTLPYKDVDETDAQYEGPSVRTREAWRRVHWDFFTDALKPLGKSPTETMPVTVERFEVVCGQTPR